MLISVNFYLVKSVKHVPVKEKMMNYTDLSSEELSLTLSHYATDKNTTRDEELLGYVWLLLNAE
jgi:hypothetical protein